MRRPVSSTGLGNVYTRKITFNPRAGMLRFLAEVQDKDFYVNNAVIHLREAQVGGGDTSIIAATRNLLLALEMTDASTKSEQEPGS